MATRENELFDWYLAFLRKNAQDSSLPKQFTPISLIEADKELLKTLIEKNARRQQKQINAHETSGETKGKAAPKRRLRRYWSLFCALSISAAMISSYSQSNSLDWSLWAVLLIAFASFLVFFFLPENSNDGVVSVINEKADIYFPDLLAAKSDGEKAQTAINEFCHQLELMAQKELIIFEYGPHMLCKLNDSGRIIDLNHEAENLTGYGQEELIGGSLVEFVLPESKHKFSEALELCKRSGEAEQIEIKLKSKKGEVIDLHWRIEWSANSSCYFCMAENISARKNNERLRLEMTAMITHDLRSPISALSFWIDNMLLGTYGEVSIDTQGSLSRCSNNIKTVLALLDDLLDAEKLESGTMKAHLSSVRVQDCFKHIEQLYHDWFIDADLTLVVNNTDCVAHADVEQTNRILRNFCSNALKWAPAKTAISIRAFYEDDSVVIEVADSGPGIPVALQETLFQRWVSLNFDPSRKAPSSGLGLYIARKLAELQGGAVGVRAAANCGSVFYLSLRRSPVIAARQDQSANL